MADQVFESQDQTTLNGNDNQKGEKDMTETTTTTSNETETINDATTNFQLPENVTGEVLRDKASDPGANLLTLPPNVTEAPQHPEHMDLRGMSGYSQYLDAYLRVSDDNGGYLGSTEVEGEAQQLCTTLAEMDFMTCTNPQDLVDRIKQFIRQYNPLINEAENTAVGILTKYRIRQGMLLVHQKHLVKKRLNLKWGQWFKENYDESLYRSAQDYMRIAKVPNAIRYAVFGKERLLNIVGRLKILNTQDPIGDFLRHHGIDFNPQEETSFEEIRIRTDVAIARSLLDQNELADVPDDKLDAFVRKGKQIKSSLLEQMKFAQRTGSNTAEYMDQLIAGESLEPTPTGKAKSYKTTLKKFLDLTENAMNDENYLGEINEEEYQRLKQMVLGLEARIQQRATN